MFPDTVSENPKAVFKFYKNRSCDTDDISPLTRIEDSKTPTKTKGFEYDVVLHEPTTPDANPPDTPQVMRMGEGLPPILEIQFPGLAFRLIVRRLSELDRSSRC